jgi:hypothetical protein
MGLMPSLASCDSPDHAFNINLMLLLKLEIGHRRGITCYTKFVPCSCWSRACRGRQPNSTRDASPIVEIERYKDGTTALLLSFPHLLHSTGSDKCISSNYFLAAIAKIRRFSLISSHIAK